MCNGQSPVRVDFMKQNPVIFEPFQGNCSIAAVIRSSGWKESCVTPSVRFK